MDHRTQLSLLGTQVDGIGWHTAGSGPHALDPLAGSMKNALGPIDAGALQSSSSQKPTPGIGAPFGLE